jgi:hypothetical protein
MNRAASLVLSVGALLAVSAAPARAQSAEGRGRLQVEAGGAWLGSVDFGSAVAGETTPTGGTRPLFSTSSLLAGAPAIEGRVGWRLTPDLMAAAELSLAHPELRISTSADDENAPPVTVSESVAQYMVGGAIVYRLPFGSRIRPFVVGGAGYLRQLHEGATLVQTGRYYEFGGGVMVPLAAHDRAPVKAIGLRVDARALIRVNGVSIDESPHLAPVAGASLYLRF